MRSQCGWAATIAVALLVGAVYIGLVAAAETDQPESRPSSVVGGQGMPGRVGSGSVWIRKEGVQDAP